MSVLLAVGKMGVCPEADLFNHFNKRLKPPFDLREIELKKTLIGEARQLAEAEAVLALTRPRDFIVALDERGASYPSGELARNYEKWLGAGARLVFAIGGADGWHETFRARAGALIALGPMTWPHLLCRGLLAEQIFRAQSILSGHPYHRV